MVEAKLTNGTVYEGILTAISPTLDIALEAAHDKAKVNETIVILDKTHTHSLSLSLMQLATRDNVVRQIRFKFSEIVQVSAKEEANRRYGGSGNTNGACSAELATGIP